MANLLQSSQTQATEAPGYFNTYLTDLAQQGTNAVKDANYVGATPLQQQAFSQTDAAASAFQPTLTKAGETLTSAGDMTSPLSSAQGYLTSATQSPAELAQSYMNPYISSAVQRMSDIGQRNIQQNLSPLATASAVGSGQFGSKRGAQVLGQVMSNAENDLNSQISKQMTEGYGQALNAAGQRNQTMAQVGSTAGNLASQGQQNLINLGKTQTDLAAQNQDLNLKRINALSTMGEQQRTIAQNKELFPLQNLSTLSGILRGYNVPTTTKTTAEQSPLSVLAGLGTGAVGLFAGTGTGGTGPSLFQQMTGKTPAEFFKSVMPGTSTTTAGSGTSTTGTLTPEGLSVMANPASPSGYSDSDGNPVKADGTPYTAPVTDQSQEENPTGGYWDDQGNWVQQ
jgi:hypothetical protein